MPDDPPLEEPTNHLRRQARRIVRAAHGRTPLRAAILAGSAGRGDADFYSDIDLLFYVDQLPPDEILEEIRTAVGGTNLIRRGEPTDHFSSEEFEFGGVRTEVSFVTVARAEERLEQLLDELEAVGSPLQKILSGILEGLPLYGDELVERWRERIGVLRERWGEWKREPFTGDSDKHVSVWEKSADEDD